jgi:hypothetical protein
VSIKDPKYKIAGFSSQNGIIKLAAEIAATCNSIKDASIFVDARTVALINAIYANRRRRRNRKRVVVDK